MQMKPEAYQGWLPSSCEPTIITVLKGKNISHYIMEIPCYFWIHVFSPPSTDLPSTAVIRNFRTAVVFDILRSAACPFAFYLIFIQNVFFPILRKRFLCQRLLLHFQFPARTRKLLGRCGLFWRIYHYSSLLIKTLHENRFSKVFPLKISPVSKSRYSFSKVIVVLSRL